MSDQTEDVAAFLRVLGRLREAPEILPERAALEARVAEAARIVRKRRRKAPGRAPAKPARAESAPRTRPCYICKAPITEPHPAYRALCVGCGALNLRKRDGRVDLRGRVALLTGARVKIGWELALKLLRDGAEVHATTRFPEDALARFAEVQDAARWRGRLHVHALDLRDIEAVDTFARGLCERLPALDVLIHNAAQTNRWPPPRFDALPEGARARAVAVAQEAAEEAGTNSWIRRLEDVTLVELVEVLMVNAAAPAILTGRLRPLLARSRFPDRYILLVAGADGRFGVASKTVDHPHVNMGKAALNMITRTCAADFLRDGIHLSSVDPGWVSLEMPFQDRLRREAAGEAAPLDAVDGAARIYDLIVRGVAGAPVSGVLFKDYAPASW